MQSVTSQWLEERGALHDACVLGLRIVGPNLEIEVDDEWVNERGLSRPKSVKAPGTFIVEGFSFQSHKPDAATGGWVSEMSLRGDELDLVFCDRPSLSLRVGAIWWRSENAASRV
jgi:hypothetical protein